MKWKAFFIIFKALSMKQIRKNFFGRWESEFFNIRYTNYIFILFELAELLSKFRYYFNTCHPNISFSFEQEKKGKSSFLDIKVSQEKEKTVTTVYTKPTLVVCTPILKVSCQQYRNLVWFTLWLLVVSIFVLSGHIYKKNLVFWKKAF